MRVEVPVLRAPKRRMELEPLELEGPRRGEVLIRMVASGVCHSCLAVADGTTTRHPLPIVLGDEGAGVVEEVGPDCRELRVGDHVVISWAPSCRRCPACLAGRPVLCRRSVRPGHMPDGSTRFRSGTEPVHNLGPATYSPYVVLEEASAVKIRDDMPLEVAALLGCSVTTGTGAVIEAAKARANDSVVVFGCGGVGLNSIQGARLVGALPIVAVDINQDRLDLARELGATHALLSGPDVVEAVRAVTGGGADVAVVAVGSVGAIEPAVLCLAPGGICVLVGLPPPGSRVELSPHSFLYGERRLVGSTYGSVNPALAFPRLVEQYLAGRLKLDELVTRRYRLEESNEAFADLAAGSLARGLIVF